MSDTVEPSRSWVEKYVHPADQPLVLAAIQEAIHTRSAYILEHRILRKDGSLGWAFSRAIPLLDAQGEIFEWFGAASDITARRQAEESIHHLNDELHLQAAQMTVANQELEAFAYSVSHDLRAPLRGIDGFSRILLRDHAPMLDAAGRETIDRIRAAAQRMAVLIDELLQLSRLARGKLNRVPLDLAELARAIAAELGANEPTRRVTWQIASQLTVMADAALMRAALENLLGNAFKFTARCADARIEFNAAQRAGERVYLVRDNGAGFDMRYIDKLFGAFQRLHSAEEFPGSGVGLAVVQRVIHRHAGRVWAEGAVGAGATFYFTLPDGGPKT